MNIGKGTADYIIQYADEDMGSVNDGKFTMADSPNVDGSGDGLLKFSLQTICILCKNPDSNMFSKQYSWKLTLLIM